MAMALHHSGDSSPMLEMNTTPLIDVMLVLLVMFIITIPTQTHAVKLDLPSNVCRECPPPNPTRNTVTITPAGAILWNGTPLTRPQLAWELAATKRMTPQPELHLQPDSAARYEIVDEVLAITKRAGIANMGFVGNERYRDF
jgi:biopolymer transport protein ExbD